MKKVLYILVTASLILSTAVACAPATATPEPTTPPATSQVDEAPSTEAEAATEPATESATSDELPFAGKTLYIVGPAVTSGIEPTWVEVNAQFEKEYGAKVVTRWSGKWDSLPQTLQTARMAGEQIDVTNCDSNHLNSILVRDGLLMDMTELVKPLQDRWEDNVFDSVTIDDHVWGIPWVTRSTAAVFYNATMFKELGIEEPETYEDLLAAAETIKAQKADVIPWIHQGKFAYMWPMWFMEAFAQTSGNQSIQYTKDFLSGTRKFTSEEEVAAFEALKKFYADGILTQTSLDTDTVGMEAAFAQQKAAMLYGGTWEVTNLRKAVQDSFEIGIFKFPLVVDDPDVVSQPGGGSDTCLAIPSFAPPEDLDMIMQYLEYITRADNVDKITQPASPLLPVLKAVTPIEDALSDELNQEYIPSTIGFLDWMWPAEVNSAIQQAIPAVMTGAMTPEQAAESVQKAYDTLVEEEGYSYDWWTSWTQDDWDKVTPATTTPTFEIK